MVAGVPATIVDRLGAGDAFTAGVIHGFLAGDLEQGVRIGTAMGSIALGITGDQVITTMAEIDEVLGGSGRAVDR